MIHNLPALPAEYYGDFGPHSDTVEAQLLRNILDHNQARIHVLRGMGGTGKTTALMAIGHRHRIKETFVDAVWFIALGQSADAEILLSSIRELIRVVRDDKRAEEMARLSALRNNQRGAIAYAVSQLADASVLLILDDVWKESEPDSVTHTQVFDLVRELALGLNSNKGPMRVAISSRNGAVAYILPHVSVVCSGYFGTHSPAAKRVICEYAGFQFEDEIASLGMEVREAFSQVLDRCQGLQLALAVAGKNVRELVDAQCATRENVWQMFRDSMLSVLLTDRSPNVESMSVRTIVESSLHTLKLIAEWRPPPEELDIISNFMVLGIMRKQRIIPWECLRLLWNCRQDTVTWFRRELAQVHLVSVDKDRGIRLHQLIQEYCTQKTQEGGLLETRHMAFLSSLYDQGRDLGLLHADESSFKVREWWSLSGFHHVLQSYVLNNVLWHLVQAKRFNEGLPLLCDFRWTQVRVLRSSSVNKVSGIEEDIELFLSAKGESWPRVVWEGLNSMFEAIHLATQYICSNPRELAFQLYGRLAHQASKNQKNQIVKQYVASLVNHAALPWLRPSYGVLQPVSDTVVRKASFDVTLECAHVISDSDKIVLGGAYGFLVLFDLSSTQILRTFTGHGKSDYINDVTVAIHGQDMFSVSNDKSIRKWSTRTAEQLKKRDFYEIPKCITLTDDENYILVGSEGGTVFVCDADNLSVLSSWHCHHGAVRVLRLAPRLNSVLSGGDDGRIRKWHVASKEPFKVQTEGQVLLEEPMQKARDISLFSDQSKAAIAAGFKVYVIDTQSGNALLWNEFDWKVLAVQVSPDQKSVYIGVEDGTTRFLDVFDKTNAKVNAKTQSLARSHNARICRMAPSADGKSIISVSADKTLSILKCNRSLTSLLTSPVHRREMYRLSNLAIFPDRERVLFAWECDPHVPWMLGLHLLNLSESSKQGTGSKRNAESDVDFVMTFLDSAPATTPVACLDKAVTAIAVSKDGNFVAAGTSVGEVLMFNPRDWNRTLFNDRKLPSKVVCIKFSPDSKLVAASCTESMVGVWKTDEDAEVELGTQPENQRVWVVEFNKESTGLVAIGDQEPLRHAIVHIWRDLRSGRVQYGRHQLSALVGHKETSIGVGLYIERSLFAMQSERFRTARVYDFEKNRRMSEDEELEFSRRLVQVHNNHCGSTKLSIAPFSSKIKYKENDGESITLGTLESSQCHSFSSDQWVFHEASGQFVAGGVLRKLVSATLIENRISHPHSPDVPFLLEDYDAINHLSQELDNDDFTFFISHAGPDKNDIAIPIYNKLKEKGKLSFVDIIGIHPGENAPKRMEKAIRDAKVAIFIMSPEFAARKWPMKELMEFQKRVILAENKHTAAVAPELLPVFYRLSRDDCKRYDLHTIETCDGKSLFVREGFYSPDRWRVMDWETVHGALKKLTEQSGILNKLGVKNRPARGESADCKLRRDILIDEIVNYAMMAAKRVECEEERGSSWSPILPWNCTVC